MNNENNKSVNAPISSLSVVIPCFNEQEVIPLVARAVQEQVGEFASKLELILVDDGSTDQSWQQIQSLIDQDESVVGLKFSRNFGKEAAIAAGLEASSGEVVIIMDADLQHPPELIPQLIQRWQQGDVDIVEAVKQLRGDEGTTKNYLARAFYRLLGRLAKLDVRGASDYKLLSRRAIEAWKTLPERTLFFRGMSAWIGFSRATVEFEVAERVAGESKWSFLQLAGLAISALTAYSAAPLGLVAITGVLFGIFALLLTIQTLLNYFSGDAVSGFTTVIILLLVVGAAILIGLAIIGIYLARIYDEIKGRPRYIIEQRGSDVGPGSASQ
ncbi:MAG: glycosyltransferase family 2 protein [bacterium]